MTDPCVPTTVESADGARLTCCAHGGQVLGWVPAGGNVDRLWLSPSMRCGPGQAIRGGVPVVFPQFSGRGPLPKHGVARDRAWEELPVDQAGEARWSARLRSDAATMAIWPHEFTLTITAAAVGRQLELGLSVRNDGHAAFDLSAALHAYLRVGAGTTVHGLGGLPAEDNASGEAPITMPAGGLPAIDRRDVAVLGVPGPVRVDDPELGDLTVEATGMPDRVVWNPGAGHEIADIPDGAEAEFVCVEPAALAAVTLAAGAEWRGRAVLRASR